MTTKKPSVLADSTFSKSLTDALIGFLHQAGLSKKQIEASVRVALRKLPSSTNARRVSNLDAGTASAIGTGFHRWFRSKPYIDESGKPRPMPLLGPGRTVESLIKSVDRELPAEVVALELVRLKLVRRVRKNYYLPTEMHSLIRTHHPYRNEYIAHSILRFLRTADDNARGSRNEIPLIERYAHVPAIPKSKVREFKDFSSQQGEALIDTINDWLEANSVKTAKRKTSTAQVGMHVFAYTSASKKSSRR